MFLRSKISFLLVLFIFGFVAAAKGGWEKQDSKSLAWFHDVFFLDDDTGWIGGSKGELLKTDDGGWTWNKAGKFTDDTIRQIHFFDEKNGMLLCERDVYSIGRQTPSYLLKTSDAGKTWSALNFTGTERSRITRIFFSKKQIGLAVGESGTVFAVGEGEVNWKKINLPTRYLFNDGVFVDNFRAFVVGGGGTIIFSEDAGNTWKRSEISGSDDKKLNSIFFADENKGWATGVDGAIFQTTNGGKDWRKQLSGVKESLTDILFVDSAKGWAIGENGTILESETAGNIWKKLNLKTKHRLEKILFIGSKGWIVGFGGTILSYEETRLQYNSARVKTK